MPGGWGNRRQRLKPASSTFAGGCNLPLRWTRDGQGSEGGQGLQLNPGPALFAALCQAFQKEAQGELSPGSPVSPSGLSAVPSHHLPVGPTRQGIHGQPCPWPLRCHGKSTLGRQFHGQVWPPELCPLSQWPLLLLAAGWTPLDGRS